MADTVTSTLDDSGPGTSTATGDIGEVATPTITPFKPPEIPKPASAAAEAPPTVDPIDPKTGLPVFTLPTAPKPAEVPLGTPKFVLPGTEPKPGEWTPVHQQPDKEMPSEAGDRPPAPQYEDHPTLADLSFTGIPHAPNESSLERAGRVTALGVGLPMAETIEGKQKILEKNLLGATFEKDKFGNPLVVYEGKKYHIARPDFMNAQTVGDAVIQAVPTIGTTAIATIPGAGTLVGLLELASAGYLGKQGRDLISRTAGSEEKFNPYSGSSFIEGLINVILPGGLKAWDVAGKNIGPGVRRALPVKEAIDETIANAHPDALVYHANPSWAYNVARGAPYSEMAKRLETVAKAHADAAPGRIANGIDAMAGPANTDVRAALNEVKGPAAKELTEAFAQAKPIDIAPMMAELDVAIGKAGNTPAGKALQKLRTMLVEQEGRTATAGTGQWVDNPIAGQPQMWRAAPGQQGAQVRYASDPQKLNDIKREFDRMIKYGDKDAGVEAQSISNIDHAIGNVRQRLSGLLNDNVKGYGEIMQKYQGAYDMHDAFLTGQKIMKGGQNALTLEDVMPYLKGNPNEMKGFEMGVREAIDNVISTAAAGKDVAALKKIVPGENNHRRKILEQLYGKDKVAALEQMAEREGNFAVTNQKMLDAVQEGKDISGATQAGKIHEPWVKPMHPGQNWMSTAYNAYSRTMNWIGERVARGKGPDFEREMADIITGPAKQTLEAVKAAAEPSLKTVGRTVSGATPGIADAPSAINEQFIQPKRDKLPRAAGGRTKYRFDCASRASKLCREAELIRKRHAGETKHLLNSSDDEVADALRVASRGL